MPACRLVGEEVLPARCDKAISTKQRHYHFSSCLLSRIQKALVARQAAAKKMRMHGMGAGSLLHAGDLLYDNPWLQLSGH